MIDQEKNEFLATRSETIKPSRKRWLVLLSFSMITFLTAFHWMIVGIVPDVTSKFFMVSESIIIWTATTYMVVYCVSVLLAFYLMSTKGLRFLSVMASGVCMIGAGFKFLSTFWRTFWLYELGQICCAVAETFAISLPARIAAVWFPSNEVSTATAIGVFGNQLGIAMSLVIPTHVITGPSNTNQTQGEFYEENTEDYEEVKAQMVQMMAITLIGNVLVFMMACFVFEDDPKYSPSRARLQSVESSKIDGGNQSTKEIIKSYIRLLSSKNFVCLCLGYGLLVGSYYALSGNINKLITPNLSDEDLTSSDKSKHAANMGLIMILAGSVASLAAGFILDAAKKFKLISVICYLLSFIMYIVWTFILGYQNLILDYVIVGILGFFMTGYLPIGFEFASEISYPESETTSSGFLNLAAMLVGAIITPIIEYIISTKGSFQANLGLCGILLFGLILTVFIKEDKKRQNAENEFKAIDSRTDEMS